MKSGKKQFFSNPDASKNRIPGQPMDRRRFLQYAAGAGAVVGLGGSALGQLKHGVAVDAAQPKTASADSRLPDGTEYVSWEQPLTFFKTYYVDNNSARANDGGPGTRERPFRTINQAAQVLQPGERVVIASGTYRECVHPVRGGTGPTQMISYEAAPGATVFVKGSEILKDSWQPAPISMGGRGFSGQPAPSAAQIITWQHELTGALFPDAYNPFNLASAPGDRSWLDTKSVDMGPYFRRRGMVFVDGKPLEPVEQVRELASSQLPGPAPPTQAPVRNGLPPRTRGGPIMQEIGGAPNARLFVNNPGNGIQVRLADGTPAEHTIEITTREQAFVPLHGGLAYIRVKGITFQHAGNGYPVPQRGLVSTAGGNHWIIEGNTIEWANGVGLDIGNGDWNGGSTAQAGLAHIIRGNTIRYCGVEGVAGMGTRDTVVEDNLIEWCGWADAERAWEAAAAKFHRAQNMLFRRNVVRHIRHANAVWFDSGNVNCRITGNVFADVVTVSAAVHMEVNLQQNQIDNNVIWNVRNAEPGTPGQRGCAGSGVFINASDRLTIAQNLIGRCDNSGVFAIIRPDRAGTGTATGNNIYNNIFTKCDKSAVVFLNQNNQADGNLYVAMPNGFLGFFTADSKQWLDLPAWRETHGWDKNSKQSDAQIDFNPNTLELTMNSSQPFPKVNVFNHIANDMFGKLTGDTRAPGPLADPGAKSIWQLDPRSGSDLKSRVG
jgi:hypothetical protein